MAVVYGLPYFLEDITGSLAGTDFVDMHDRMKFNVRCTLRDSSRAVYMVHDIRQIARNGPGARVQQPAAVLDYGPKNALGSVTVGTGPAIPMEQYLSKLSRFGSSKQRKFIAVDGKQYMWRWRVSQDFEWSCTDENGAVVAFYNLKTPGEHYPKSSGCMLTIEEVYPHLAADLITSLLIMRHIHEYNL